MTPLDLRVAAERWIAAWHRRDLAAILEHYADDAEICSPHVVRRYGIADGWIRGKDRVGDYFALGLRLPNLRFELVDVLAGVNAMALVYRREGGELVVDCCELDHRGLIRRATACYGLPRTARDTTP